MIQRAVAASWKLSSARYGGRSWPLAAVMLSNLMSVVLFGGGLMLILVATAEYCYALMSPERYTWFTGEAWRALTGYGAVAFFASVVPVFVTGRLNAAFRRRCRTCDR